MQVAVVGCGQMGSAAAYALARRGEVERLVLVDRDSRRLAGVVGWLRERSDVRIVAAAGDVDDARALAGLVRGSAALAVALDWQPTLRVIEAALEQSLPLASIARPDLASARTLDRRARARRVTHVLGCGLEPGLTEIAARQAVEPCDEVEELHIRCGGVPARPWPPLGYARLFGERLPLSPRATYAIEQGRLRRVARFSGVERLDVEEVGELEAYHDGLLPWLADDPHIGAAARVTQKTLRWPGFAQRISTLAELGLLDEEPLDVGGQHVAPRDVVEAVLRPRVARRPDDEDVTVLLVEAHGRRDGRRVRRVATLVDRFDPTTQLTAMARTTGFTLAAATRLLATRAIPEPGSLQPQAVVTGPVRDALLDELAGHGIRFTWREDPS